MRTPEAVPGPLLAVYAHPDDETIQAGALLALAAAQGRRVVVVHATRGERGEMIGAPEIEGTEAVPVQREQEVGEALAALGVAEHYWLDELAPGARWTDSGMTWLAEGVAGPAADAPATALTSGDLSAQAAALADLVRRVRPALVVCDEPGGSYGHPDHIRTHEITLAALELARTGDGEPIAGGPAAGGLGADGSGNEAAWAVPALGWVVQDEQRLRAARAQLRTALAQMQETFDVASGPLPALARPAREIDVELDAISVLPHVIAALRAQPSQIQGVSLPALDRGLWPARALRDLSTDQAAVGWFALSNEVAQPILPVIGLQFATGDAASAGLAELPRADARTSRTPEGEPLASGGRDRLWPRVLAGALLGIVAAIVGTLVHRARVWDLPYGLVIAVVLVVIGGLLARSIGRGGALAGYGLGVLAGVQALTYLGPGQNILVAQDTLGLAWLAASLGGVVLAAFLPGRWAGR